MASPMRIDADALERIAKRKAREAAELLAMEERYKAKSRGGRSSAAVRRSAAPRAAPPRRPVVVSTTSTRSRVPTNAEELRRIYAQVCPSKVRGVEAVLRKWRGREEDLMKRVRAKYGVAALTTGAVMRSGGSASAAGPGRLSAARSHEANRAYMERFDGALEGGAGEYCGSAALTEERASTLAPSRAVRTLDHQPLRRAAMASGWFAAASDGVAGSARWDASDRPILASSLRDGTIAVACSDHAVYTYSVRDVGRRAGGGARQRRAGGAVGPRKLYTKRCGHTDWVTCVAHVPDGRILSGGSDSKLCLWAAGGGAARCTELVGHRGSISAVAVASDGACAVSASYDATLRVWCLASGGGGRGGGGGETCAATLQRSARKRGHRDPVLCFTWLPAHEVLLSGDRGGDALLWDVRAAQVSRSLDGHRGHITALESSIERGSDAASSPLPMLFFTGAQDGHVRVWDVRQERAVVELPAHVSIGRDGRAGSGAVHSIALAEGGSLLVSGGADGAVCTFDPRAGFAARAQFIPAHSDFVYAMRVVADCVLTGGGGGDVVMSRLADGVELGRVRGSRAGAVRCIEADASTLVVAGDDGDVAAWSFFN